MGAGGLHAHCRDPSRVDSPSSTDVLDSAMTRAQIVLATHNPRMDLLERQVASVVAQSVTDWRCLVLDDSSSAGARRDIAAVLGNMKQQGLQLIDETPRIGAEGKKIAFVHPKSLNGMLVELSEDKDEG